MSRFVQKTLPSHIGKLSRSYIRNFHGGPIRRLLWGHFGRLFPSVIKNFTPSDIRNMSSIRKLCKGYFRELLIDDIGKLCQDLSKVHMEDSSENFFEVTSEDLALKTMRQVWIGRLGQVCSTKGFFLSYEFKILIRSTRLMN